MRPAHHRHCRYMNPEDDRSPAPSLPVQSVHLAPRCALVSTTDRWATRLGGLDDRNKSAQGQPRDADDSTIWPRVAYYDCYIDRPNSRIVFGACCGMCCSTC